VFRILLQRWSGLCLLGLLAATHAPAAQTPVPLDEYWQKLDDTQALVASLGAESPERVATRLNAAADEWAAITSVTLPAGESVPVDHGFLVAQLRSDPADLEKIDQILQSLMTTHEDWPPPRHTSADLRALNEILARREFQWQVAQPSPLELLWQKAEELLWRFLNWLLPDDVVVTIGADLVTYAITGLAAIALIVVMLYVARSLAISFASESEVNPAGEHGDETLTADAALKRAQSLSASGDYRTAVRYLYLSALLLLDERGLLRYDRSLTNREYLRTVAHLPEVQSTLRDVVEVFDRVWYGFQPLDSTAFDQYAARVAQLRQQR